MRWSLFARQDEVVPICKTKSKRYIQKVMFLSAVARPRYNPQSKTWFDGKLGIFAFVEQVAAQQSSKNRAAGTMETKGVSVTGNAYKTMMIEKLLPEIAGRFPLSRNKIIIQEDGASSHNCAGAIENAAFRNHALNVEVIHQPPQSPQFNALDCGIFNLLQKKVYKQHPCNIDELIAAIQLSYDNMEMDSIDNVFLSVQCSMEDCLKTNGDNTTPLRHMSKGMLRRQGCLPVSISVSPYLISSGRRLM